jgi:dienelactone hydrolase
MRMAVRNTGVLCAAALVVCIGIAVRDPILRLTASLTRHIPRPVKRVTAVDVSFPSGNLRIAGTLYSPAPILGRHPAVVISHGGTRLGRRLALYTVAARKLAERGYVVLAIDLRGFGDSERPRRFENSSDLDFPQDIVAAVDYLNTLHRVDPRRINVAGHSFGAGVAVAAAVRDHRIARAVSIAPGRNNLKRFYGPGAPDPGYPSRRMSRDMGVDPPIPPALFDPHLKDYAAEAILDYPTHPPILLVDGGEERTDDLSFLGDVAARMTAPKGYVTIPGADHYFGTGRDQEGSATAPACNAAVMDALVAAIDDWLRKGRL